MTPKYYWLLSDHKTVREISIEEYCYLNKFNWKPDYPQSYLLIVAFDSEIHVRKAASFVDIPLKQLKQILEMEKEV